MFEIQRKLRNLRKGFCGFFVYAKDKSTLVCAEIVFRAFGVIFRSVNSVRQAKKRHFGSVASSMRALVKKLCDLASGKIGKAEVGKILKNRFRKTLKTSSKMTSAMQERIFEASGMSIDIFALNFKNNLPQFMMRLRGFSQPSTA